MTGRLCDDDSVDEMIDITMGAHGRWDIKHVNIFTCRFGMDGIVGLGWRI